MDYQLHFEQRFRKALSELISGEFGCGLPMETIKVALLDEVKCAEAVISIGDSPPKVG